MADMDPRLNEQLDKLYRTIEGTKTPPGLQRFDARSHASRWAVAKAWRGVASAAVLALFIGAVVVIGLTNHRPPGVARTGPAAALAPTPTPVPSSINSATASPSPSPTSPPSATPSQDPTASWTTFSNPSSSYSLRYPSSWYRDGPCTTGQVAAQAGSQLRLAPHADAVCGSDSSNNDITVDVSGTANYYTFTPSACTQVSTVTVDGVRGTRTTSSCGGYAVEYEFNTNGHTYAISFGNGPSGSGSDLTADLDLMMTRTWAFHG